MENLFQAATPRGLECLQKNKSRIRLGLVVLTGKCVLLVRTNYLETEY